MVFKPVKTKKIYEEIIDQIKDLIEQGVLKPGDKLMSERDLAEKLEVGRSAVREAFRALEAMGIIASHPGEGTFIRKLGNQEITTLLAPALLMEHSTIRELLELRKIMELDSAALAAQRRTQADLEQIQQALVQMERDIETADLGEQADLSFHYAIVTATHNSLLIKLMNNISDIMCRALEAARRELYRTPGTPERLLQDHKLIYEAIKQQQPQQARQAMLKHLSRVEKELLT